ncbi:hypothetical protein L6164_019627 [Bauhinia variegata]|uniref:Uncharacterized protein n=1 Tax=Bauhinia variegata TaxID=167791 RepID=A0ACB9MSQ7_BAUVA|nr:hypothetical protein L6164_019627 [Bauhinia variegata]
MEKHKCKLCSRTFANGRALGGHMKAHLATLPLPPKPEPLGDSALLSYSSSEEEEEEEALGYGEPEQKGLIYELRENPKKSFRLADPEFSFAIDNGAVVLDRESETESKNPTRRRSKRNRKSSIAGSPTQNQDEKLELKRPKPCFPESPLEPEPASSVSDTSPEEDVAMCLVMLSRDRWVRNIVKEDQDEEVQELRSVEESRGLEKIKLKRVRGKHQCDNCRKTFRSSRALDSHKNICFLDETQVQNAGNDKIFECPYCRKIFGSGQALGGHKRSHLLASSSSTVTDSGRLKEAIIDLNLPAPAEEDELSVLSDA